MMQVPNSGADLEFLPHDKKGNGRAGVFVFLIYRKGIPDIRFSINGIQEMRTINI